MLSLKSSRAYALLLASVAVAFAASLPGDFLYDDTSLIRDNDFAHNWKHAGRAFSTHFWDVSAPLEPGGALRYYRPLVSVSYLLNWTLADGRPWTFHAVNLLLHGLNACLAFRVGRRILGSSEASLACSLLFALHPTRSESVAWISGRPDLLMASFVLLALSVSQERWTRLGTMARALAATTCFLAAVLSKEPGLATVVVLLSFAAVQPAGSGKGSWITIGCCLVAASIYLLVRRTALPVGAPDLAFTPGHGLVTLKYYVERLLFPWPLTFFYKVQTAQDSVVGRSPWDVAGGLLVLLAAGYLAHRSWRKDRMALAMFVSAGAFLGPLLNFTETTSKFTVSDRFLYLPLWLVSLALVRLFQPTVEHLLARRASRLSAYGLLWIFAGMNLVRGIDFLDDRALWRAELEVNPNNPVALRSLAVVLEEDGRTREAEMLLRSSLRRESLKHFTLATPEYNIASYAQLVSMLGRQLPDGAQEELEQLARDVLDRLSGRLRSQHSPSLGDWPTEPRELAALSRNGEQILAPYVAPLLTRLELLEPARELLDSVPNEGLAQLANPAMVAISEARVFRFDRARERLSALEGNEGGARSSTDRSALQDVRSRIDAADAHFRAAVATTDPEQSIELSAALATLGAYGRALAQLEHLPATDPRVGPLRLELLLLCRYDAEAASFAESALGRVQGQIAVARLRAQLPPPIASLSPVSRSRSERSGRPP